MNKTKVEKLSFFVFLCFLKFLISMNYCFKWIQIEEVVFKTLIVKPWKWFKLFPALACKDWWHWSSESAAVAVLCIIFYSLLMLNCSQHQTVTRVTNVTNIWLWVRIVLLTHNTLKYSTHQSLTNFIEVDQIIHQC